MQAIIYTKHSATNHDVSHLASRNSSHSPANLDVLFRASPYMLRNCQARSPFAYRSISGITRGVLYVHDYAPSPTHKMDLVATTVSTFAMWKSRMMAKSGCCTWLSDVHFYFPCTGRSRYELWLFVGHIPLGEISLTFSLSQSFPSFCSTRP